MYGSLRGWVPAAVITVSGVQAKAGIGGGNGIKKLLRFGWCLDVSPDMRMKHQFQPEIRGDTFRFSYQPRGLAQTVRLEGLASIDRDAPGQFLPFRRLVASHHNVRRSKRGQKLAHLANVLNNRWSTRGICQRYRHKGGEHRQLFSLEHR